MLTEMFVNVYADGKTIVSAERISVDDNPAGAANTVRRIVRAAYYNNGLAKAPDYDVFSCKMAAVAAGPR